MKTIELTRRAAELREQAQKRLDDLKEKIQRQADGQVPEGETKLSPEEIREETAQIQGMVEEAKSIEGLDTVEGMAKRGGDASETAREILAHPGAPEEAKASPWPTLNAFLRSVRAKAGGYEREVTFTEDQSKAMGRLRAAATRVQRGDRVKAEDLDIDSKALVGDDSTSSGRGDYLVPSVYLSELLQAMAENQEFAPRARQVPFARPTIALPRLAQTTAADTRPIFSFAAVTTQTEAGQAAEREPTFEQFTVTAYKYMAYTEASDELLEDSIVPVPSFLGEILRDSIGWEYDYDCMRGAGSGSNKPTGWLGHASEYAVNRGTASQVGAADVFGMEARFFGSGGIYLYHPSVIPQLYALNASNVIVWNGDLSAAAPGTLLGRPLIRTHKLPSLGTKGDIALVDPSFYIAGNMGGIVISTSPHYKFRNDVMAWRATFRAAGSPWPAGNFSMMSDGSSVTYGVSPFVPLDTPAAS